MDIMGNTVGRSTLKNGVPVTSLTWNCERFNMEEQSEAAKNGNNARPDGRPFVLAVGFKNGEVHLLRSYDDLIPQIIEAGFQSYVFDWTNSGETLAVAGKVGEVACKEGQSFRYLNEVKFYNDQGNLISKVPIPSEKVTGYISECRIDD